MFHQVQTSRAIRLKEGQVYNYPSNYLAVDYQLTVYGNTADQFHGFMIDYE